MTKEKETDPANTSGQVLPEHDLDTGRMDDLRVVLAPTKARLLQQLLASPTGTLSAIEIAARNSITESTIRDHLRDLQNRNRPIVSSLKATESPVPNGIPRTYFAVTTYGIELLKQVNLYEQIGVLFDMYEAADLALPDEEKRPVTIKDIEEYEHRPQPDWR